ncbi:hypothetical protein [Paraburkholderia elongata]|uniref:Uncharacterized protein n=1 Tax=Paraburkholderia elongata TaxID=2675747 RepID=A0A972SNU3_9BURK|nr:hypothetical protein [Paraburkholderia elongata]NPT62563.1 hypothetical protein [Paraburkholderia elongata]
MSADARIRIVGRVREINRGTEEKKQWSIAGNPYAKRKSIQIWRFVVVSFDKNGNVAQRAPVELRGESILGLLDPGDEVEITSGRPYYGTTWTDRVYNKSTHSIVKVEGSLAPPIPAENVGRFLAKVIRSPFFKILLLALTIFAFYVFKKR